MRKWSAESHLKKSKLDQAQSYRESLRDEKAADVLEQSSRVARTSERRAAVSIAVCAENAV